MNSDIQANLQKFNIDLNKPIKDLNINYLRALEKIAYDIKLKYI